MLKYILFVGYLFTAQYALCQSGSVGIGTSQPAAGAILEIKSPDKTIIIPRLSTASLNAITSPAAGMIAYDINKEKLVTFVNAPAVNSIGQFVATHSRFLNSDQSIGQSFIAPSNIRLKEILVYLVTQNTPTNFTMYLHDGTGIGGSILDSAKISTVAVTSELKAFSFAASGITLQEGNVYTFQLRSDVVPALTASIYIAAGDPYPNGNLFTGSTPEPGNDLYFFVNSLTGAGVWHSLAAAPGNTNMLAVAYGNVFSNATTTINNSSNNCTLNHTGTGVYEISFSSTNLSVIDPATLPVNVSLFGATPGFITFSGGVGKIIVRTFNTAGAATDRGFGFTVFQP